MSYLEKQSGVYRITCKKTTRSYVGSSKSIKDRFTWHKFILRHNSPMIGYGLTRPHPCQEDWNIFGEKNFEFSIIELCDISLLKERENYWMNHEDYIDRYNDSVDAYGSGKRSNETKALMSEIAKERNMRPEYNKMLSERAKEQHRRGELGRKSKNGEGRPRSTYPGAV